MQAKARRSKKNRTWICPQCFSEETGPLEFETEEEWREHMKTHHTIDVKKPKQINKPKPAAVEKPKVKPEPLKLTYKWTGQCSNCGGQVDTLDISIRNDFFVVAWCNGCKRKLAQRKVAKL